MLIQIICRIFLTLHDDHREQRTCAEILNLKISEVSYFSDQAFIGLLLSAAQILEILFILADTV
jgi:hypothetical protein